MTTIVYITPFSGKRITLSANAVLNGHPPPIFRPITAAGITRQFGMPVNLNG